MKLTRFRWVGKKSYDKAIFRAHENKVNCTKKYFICFKPQSYMFPNHTTSLLDHTYGSKITLLFSWRHWFMASKIPDALQPDMITDLPWLVCKHLYTFVIVLPCIGLSVDSFKSTSIVATSRSGSFWSIFIIVDVKYSLNSLLSNFFSVAFVIKSRGWNKCVKCFGTITTLIRWEARTSLTRSVDCALKASHIRGAFWSSAKLFSFFTFWIYGTRISSMRLRLSASLLQCLIL